MNLSNLHGFSRQWKHFCSRFSYWPQGLFVENAPLVTYLYVCLRTHEFEWVIMSRCAWALMCREPFPRVCAGVSHSVLHWACFGGLVCLVLGPRLDVLCSPLSSCGNRLSGSTFAWFWKFTFLWTLPHETWRVQKYNWNQIPASV